MKANKRGSKKGKASPMAVNLGAWLRCYASDEQLAIEALERVHGAKEKPIAWQLSEKDRSRK